VHPPVDPGIALAGPRRRPDAHRYAWIHRCLERWTPDIVRDIRNRRGDGVRRGLNYVKLF